MAKRKTIGLTKKQLRLIKYNDIIALNKKKVKAGFKMTREEFTKLFELEDIVHTGHYTEIQRSNLDLVQAQTEINMLMRENGLYIQSKNYYSTFMVSEKARTKRTVLRYRQESEVYDNCSNRLEAKVLERTKAGDWGTYKKVSVSRISSMQPYDPSESYRKQRNNLKWV